jgi:5-methylcytosine-specific restriction endonuclease McrA
LLRREGDGYTLREIAERDGWRCHICLSQVPDRPYKARPNDATIDHLIPVSAGGMDVRSNVALAHNVCNSKRSNTGPAQLRLVG